LLTDCSRTGSWPVLGEQLGRLLYLGSRRLPHQVRVHLARDCRAGVTKDHLHNLDRHATGKHQRARAVPSVVQADDRQPASPHVGLEGRRHAAGTQWKSGVVAEHQVVIAVVLPEELPLLQLGLAVSTEYGLSRRSERNPPPPGPGLRPLEVAPNVLPDPCGPAIAGRRGPASGCPRRRPTPTSDATQLPGERAPASYRRSSGTAIGCQGRL
jgi:hypothetical protein